MYYISIFIHASVETIFIKVNLIKRLNFISLSFIFNEFLFFLTILHVQTRIINQ